MSRRGADGRKGRKRDQTEKGALSEEKSGEADQKPGWKENVRSLAAAVVIFILLRLFVLDTFYITSGSMEDSLLVGDFLVVNDAAIGTMLPDILVFDPPHEENMKLVKRLVGLPGDTLEMRDRVLYLNGEPQEEPYVKSTGRAESSDPWMSWQASYLVADVNRAEYRPTRDNWGPIAIPEDRYFMMGDNRDNSLDSRYWGLLEKWRLEGRVSFIYYSYNSQSYRPFPFLREIRWGRIFDRPR
jgi:signal peptidase I